MNDGPTRLVYAAMALLVVWVVVYWAWPGSTDPSITFADAPPEVIHRNVGESIIETTRPAPESILREPPPPLVDDSRRRIAVLAPQTTTYVVRTNDTMERIAGAVYGDTRLWTVIARANNVDPTKLRPGMTLQIPVDPNNIQGIPVQQAEQPLAPVRAESTIEYIVARGDTLGQISRTYYGTTSMWQIILDANRDKIRRPEDIKPGMRLVIPPHPSGARPGR